MVWWHNSTRFLYVYLLERPVGRRYLGYNLFNDQRQRLYQLDRLDTHHHHLPDQPHDVLFIIGAIWVTRNAAAFVGTDLVLVDHPFQRRAVAQAIVETLIGDASECQRLVNDNGILCRRQFHLRHTPRERYVLVLDPA